MSVETMRSRRRLTRTYEATAQTVWELWTTARGIESWWGPEGFRVEVRELDLRPGGKLVYSMIAEDEGIKRYLIEQGIPTTHPATIVFEEVVAYRRLAFTNVVDFVPEMDPYQTSTLVEFEPVASGVRLVVTLEAMHDEEWTERAVNGWESELEKLGRLLGGARE
jgi:uncharacterized protein YndB with AHSA1/START domain